MLDLAWVLPQQVFYHQFSSGCPPQVWAEAPRQRGGPWPRPFPRGVLAPGESRDRRAHSAAEAERSMHNLKLLASLNGW